MTAILGNMAWQITGDINPLKQKLNQAQGEVRGAGSRMGAALEAAKGPSFALAGALGLVAGGIGFLGLKSVGMAADMEQTRIAFTTMLGSAQKADAFIRDLQGFAAKTPFEFAGLKTTAQQLMAMGFQSKQVIPVMTAVGNAVAALGGGQPLIDRVTLAMGQMQSKGKVAGDDIRQLAEAGIPVWKYLAATLRMDIPHAMDAVQRGAVKSDVGIRALVEGMNKDFPGMMEKQSHTITGIWSNIQDAIGQSLTTIGTMIANTFDIKSKLSALSDFLTGFMADLQKNGPGIAIGHVLESMTGISTDDMVAGMRDLGNALNHVRDAVGAVAERIQAALSGPLSGFRDWVSAHFDIAVVALAGAIAGLLVPALWAMATAFVGAVIAAAPFLIIGGAIAVLAYLLITRWQQITTWIHNTIMAHQNLINIVLLFMGPVGAVIKVIAILIDHWKQVATWIGNVIQKVQDLIGWISRIKLPDFSKMPVVGGVLSFVAQVHAQGGEAAYTGLHWLEKGELVLNKRQQMTAGAGAGLTVQPVLFSPIPPSREQMLWMRDYIRRLDKSQS